MTTNEEYKEMICDLVNRLSNSEKLKQIYIFVNRVFVRGD